MAVDDFLLISSPDWTEVPGAAGHVENNIGLATLQGMIDDSDWTGITAAFQDFWDPPEGQQIVDARVVNNDELHLYFKLALI